MAHELSTRTSPIVSAIEPLAADAAGITRHPAGRFVVEMDGRRYVANVPRKHVDQCITTIRGRTYYRRVTSPQVVAAVFAEITKQGS